MHNNTVSGAPPRVNPRLFQEEPWTLVEGAGNVVVGTWSPLVTLIMNSLLGGSQSWISQASRKTVIFGINARGQCFFSNSKNKL